MGLWGNTGKIVPPRGKFRSCPRRPLLEIFLNHNQLSTKLKIRSRPREKISKNPNPTFVREMQMRIGFEQICSAGRGSFLLLLLATGSLAAETSTGFELDVHVWENENNEQRTRPIPRAFGSSASTECAGNKLVSFASTPAQVRGDLRPAGPHPSSQRITQQVIRVRSYCTAVRPHADHL